MTSTTLFYIFIGILVFNFLVDYFLDYLNAKHFKDDLPPELQDVYDNEEYITSQKYKATNQRFSNITSLFSLMLTLGFFFLDGFKFVDDIARSYSSNSIVIALLFFGIIMLASDIITPKFYI